MIVARILKQGYIIGIKSYCETVLDCATNIAKLVVRTPQLFGCISRRFPFRPYMFPAQTEECCPCVFFEMTRGAMVFGVLVFFEVIFRI